MPIALELDRASTSTLNKNSVVFSVLRRGSCLDWAKGAIDAQNSLLLLAEVNNTTGNNKSRGVKTIYFRT